ncbi:hypothetical protein OL67_002850 [Phaeobacter piscinae]|nr:hypothetical protein OL67_002850 [Phaeobacter piscinae]
MQFSSDMRAEPVRGRKWSARPFCRRQTFGLTGRTGAARAASASGGEDIWLADTVQYTCYEAQLSETRVWKQC